MILYLYFKPTLMEKLTEIMQSFRYRKTTKDTLLKFCDREKRKLNETANIALDEFAERQRDKWRKEFLGETDVKI